MVFTAHHEIPKIYQSGSSNYGILAFKYEWGLQKCSIALLDISNAEPLEKYELGLPRKRQKSNQRHISNQIKKRFECLSNEWQKETAHLSSATHIAMHPAYQQIIGMGKDVIPLILRELEDNSRQWFWALISITGENPVDPEHKGNIKEMTRVWINWGREKGYY